MNVFINYVLPLLIGGVMGLGSHALRNNNLIRKPRINKTSWNLGFLLDSGFGAVASLLGVILADADEIRIIVLISILAGYAGENFIKNLAVNNLPINYKVNKEKQESINQVLGYKSDKDEKE